MLNIVLNYPLLVSPTLTNFSGQVKKKMIST